jgi:hypothetical protein
MNITRHQLIGLGVTKHQATELTKTLKPVAKQGQSNLYSLGKVLEAIATRLQNKRIRTITRAALEKLHTTLNDLAINVVSVPFGASEDEMSKSVKSLMKSASSSKTMKHKMKAAELTGKALAHAG